MVKRLSFAQNWIVLAAWCGLLLMVAYGGTLWLPFFFDDYVHLPFVDEHSLLQIWQTAGDLAYFRPLPFSIWEVMNLVVGEHSPVLHRLFNLFLQGSSGLLVAWLATPGIVQGKWLRRYSAAALFLLFPFSYQAVPWAGALSQLLVTFLVLLACVSYGKARQNDSRLWYVMSFVATCLAPFAHESGIVIGPLLGLMELGWFPEKQPVKTWLFRVILWCLPAILWLPVRLLVPDGPSSTITFGHLETFFQNSFYFVQGLAYPLTWLGGWLRTTWGWNDLVVIAFLSLIVLIPAFLFLLRRKKWQTAIFPLGWFGLTSLPAILFLRFDYVINGPRLLLLASAGIALFWTHVVAVALYKNQSRYPFRMAVVALLLIILAQNISFIRERMAMHRLLGDLYIQVGESTARDDKADFETVVINFPSWLAPIQATYALGHEGVLFWPDYAFPEVMVQLQTGHAAAFQPARVDAIRTEWGYFYGLAGQPPEWNSLTQRPHRFYTVTYQAEKLHLQLIGEFLPAAAAAPPLASFADAGVAMALAEVRAEQVGPVVYVTMTWQGAHIVAENVTVFVHVLNGAGQLIGQVDGDFLAGTLPLTVWPPQQQLQDRRQITVTDAAALVAIGIYRRDDGQRLPAVDNDNIPWPDQAVVVPVLPVIP